MSLQIWLPLRGNLNNNGIASATITNSNATVDASGKIGSCYSFNGSTSCIEITCSSFPTFFSGPFSICMWFYNNDNSSRSILFGNWSLTGSFFNVEKFANNTVRFYWNGSPDITFESATLPAGVWTHLTVTRSENTVKCYINGELKQTSTTALTNAPGSTATLFRIGRDNRSDDTATNGKFNDFRLYDHALSAEEVKEISKGLILHLPLNNDDAQNPNLLPHTGVATYGLGYMAAYSSGTVAVDNTVLFNGKPTIKITPSTSSTSSGGWNAYNSSVSLTAGKIYTYSCYIRSSIADEWNFSSLGHYQAYTSDNSHNSTDRTFIKYIVPANQWVKVVQKFKCTVNSVFRSFFIYFTNTSQTIWISDVKLEEGEVDTPWKPHTSDTDYPTVYDMSGYGNNGTLSSTSPSVVKGAPRKYKTSMFFNGTNNFIMCGRGAMVRDAFTINMWAYMSDWSKYSNGMRLASCTEGGGWNFEQNGTNNIAFLVGTGTTSNAYKYTITNTGLSSLSGWVMWTGTYDGFRGKVYINGILDNTLEIYTTKTPIYYHSSNGIFIGCEAAGDTTTSGGAYFNGRISDFRIYATALSAEDIYKLYDTINSTIFTDQTNFNNESDLFIKEIHLNELQEALIKLNSYLPAVDNCGFTNCCESCQDSCICQSDKCQACQNTCTCQSDKCQKCQNSCTNCTNKNQKCQNSCTNCTNKNQKCQSCQRFY